MSNEPEFRNEVYWSVVRGETNGRLVDVGQAGVTVPAEILAWAESHGLHIDDPNVWIGVTPVNEAGDVPNEISYCKGTVNDETLRLIRDALVAE